MQSELHRNNVYQSVELLLIVLMLFLLAIPQCLLIFKEIVITLVTISEPHEIAPNVGLCLEEEAVKETVNAVGCTIIGVHSLPYPANLLVSYIYL